MVRIVLPSGFVYHQPPYTEEELADLYRRTANIVGFTRPGPRKGPQPAQTEPDVSPDPPLSATDAVRDAPLS
jgi:hypothetical protein